MRSCGPRASADGPRPFWRWDEPSNGDQQQWGGCWLEYSDQRDQLRVFVDASRRDDRPQYADTSAPGDEIGSFRAWLSEALGSPKNAERLASYCERREVQAGEVIARQGAAADGMHFILEGRIGILVELGENRRMRVRSLGRHTTIGEMGLITHRMRSATIQAEAASVLYELTSGRSGPYRCRTPEGAVCKIEPLG